MIGFLPSSKRKSEGRETPRCCEGSRVCGVLLAALAGCRSESSRGARTELLDTGVTISLSDPSDVPASGGGQLPPLTEAVWLETLPMPAGHDAVVSVPLGAREARPVMIGMHGAGDRPEWACGGYRAATDAFPFIVCPRGVPHGSSEPEKFDSPGPARIAQDVGLAMQSLRARFGSYVAPGPLLYAGFSLGAIHGAKVVADEPTTFPTALFIEGGYKEIDLALARRYANNGGKRVMLACGQTACPALFAGAERALSTAGIEVQLVNAHTGRHNLDGPMMHALREAWPWLVAGDPRWAGFGR
jgi:predicted esterase